MSQLSNLLNRLNTREMSSRRIAEEAAKHGHTISHASVSRYMNGTHPAKPSNDVLEGLAAAFRIDAGLLRATAGVPQHLGPFELPADAAALNREERAAILQLVRVMVDQKTPQQPGAVDYGLAADTSGGETVSDLIERGWPSDDEPAP